MTGKHPSVQVSSDENGVDDTEVVGDEKKNPLLAFRATEGVVDDTEVVGDQKNPSAQVSSDGGGGSTSIHTCVQAW